ncbi:MAG: hypothetical protein ACRDSZ_04510 [Pseudonocardiaceae bacterium]
MDVGQQQPLDAVASAASGTPDGVQHALSVALVRVSASGLDEHVLRQGARRHPPPGSTLGSEISERLYRR